MSRTLGRILLTSLLALGATLPAAATAAGCDAGISLACTGLVPPADPAPDPEPAPPPDPAPPQPEPEPAPTPSGPATEEGTTVEHAIERLRTLIDAERRTHGLGDLASRSDLSAVAATHSRSMAERGELRHNDDLFTAATKDRLGLRLVGENVAANGSIDDAHRRLMASAGHRANLLSASFAQFGLGVARAGNTWFITEVFATPVAPRPAPRPTATPAGASPSALRRAVAPPPGPAATDRSPSSAAAPAPSGAGSTIAVSLEVPAPSGAASSPPAPAGPGPARSGASRAPVSVALVLLLGVVGTFALAPTLRTMLLLQITAVLSTFRAWTRRLRLLRAVAGLRPRRLGAP